MPDHICLAFYTGKGNPVDRAIRIATQSPYSHVELVYFGAVVKHRSRTMLAISASARDGGVREKAITFQAGHWDFLPLENWCGDFVWSKAKAEVGRPYDYLGILFNFTVPIRRHLRGSWFCSELCGHALGLDQPHRLSPGALYDVVKARNAAHLGPP